MAPRSVVLVSLVTTAAGLIAAGPLLVPATGSPIRVLQAPGNVALGDVNNDRRPDLLATSSGDRRVAVLLGGDGRGGFKRSAIPVRTGRTWFAAFGDLNGDGRPDLVTTHTEDRLLSVLLGDGRGSFIEVRDSPFDLGQKAWYVAIADFDRDRHADVVAAAETGLRVMLGDGRGAFSPAAGSPFATGKGTWRLALGDLNADGKADVATSNLESNSLTVLLGR